MEPEEPSPYELQRLRNIKRNQKVIESLGLSNPSKKRQRPAKKPPAKKLKVGPTRRSMRTLGKDAPHYGEHVLEQAEMQMRSSKADILKRRKSKAKKSGEPRTYENIPTPPAADSSRSLNVDLRMLMTKFLGAEMPGPPTKQSVMLTSGKDQSVAPRFSKYSGVTEWKNCIFLWVNIGGTDYTNQFLQDGRQMTWFAGSRHTEDTREIKRALKLTQSAAKAAQAKSNGSGKAKGKGKSKAKANNKSSTASSQGEREDSDSFGDDAVLLFCRLPKEPYVFCGRCAYVKHNPDVHPLQFVWQLADFDELQRHEKFLQILKGGEEDEE